MIKLSKAIIKEAFARNERWIAGDNIEIPECYTKIDEDALCMLSATKINTNEVTTIGKHACVGCYNLKEIYLPKVEKIELGFCYSCPNLEKITVKEETTANLIKDMLDSYDEKRSADINIYIGNNNEPFLIMPKDKCNQEN